MEDSDNKYTSPEIPTTIAPWLTVKDGVKAVKFYQAAFGAEEVYRLELPDGGLVSRMVIHKAEFWVSGEPGGENTINQESLHKDSMRMILTVTNPDIIFVQALEAGAIQVFPVGEDHGWRLGRLTDPFGFHWEIGRPLISSQ